MDSSDTGVLFDDIIRNILMSAKICLYILKAYIMVYIDTNFRDSSFSQLEVKARTVLPTHLPRPTQKRVPKSPSRIGLKMKRKEWAFNSTSPIIG